MGKNVIQIRPEDIINQLTNRLKATNSLWSKKDDDTEQENCIYFKYYFDLSCAIESCIRGIIFEYSKNEIVGKCIKSYAEPENGSKSYFVSKEHFSNIVNEEKIFNNTSIDEFYKYQDLFENTISKHYIRDFTNFETTKNIYNSIRIIRNVLAHGLFSTATFVEYSKERLIDFMYIFYLLHNYYKTLID